MCNNQPYDYEKLRNHPDVVIQPWSCIVPLRQPPAREPESEHERQAESASQPYNQTRRVAAISSHADRFAIQRSRWRLCDAVGNRRDPRVDELATPTRDA